MPIRKTDRATPPTEIARRVRSVRRFFRATRSIRGLQAHCSLPVLRLGPEAKGPAPSLTGVTRGQRIDSTGWRYGGRDAAAHRPALDCAAPRGAGPPLAAHSGFERGPARLHEGGAPRPPARVYWPTLLAVPVGAAVFAASCGEGCSAPAFPA